jgi:hypothetical protein
MLLESKMMRTWTIVMFPTKVETAEACVKAIEKQEKRREKNEKREHTGGFLASVVYVVSAFCNKKHSQ